jgi:hypothetical protein
MIVSDRTVLNLRMDLKDGVRGQMTLIEMLFLRESF